MVALLQSPGAHVTHDIQAFWKHSYLQDFDLFLERFQLFHLVLADRLDGKRLASGLESADPHDAIMACANKRG